MAYSQFKSTLPSANTVLHSYDTLEKQYLAWERPPTCAGKSVQCHGIP